MDEKKVNFDEFCRQDGELAEIQEAIRRGERSADDLLLVLGGSLAIDCGGGDVIVLPPLALGVLTLWQLAGIDFFNPEKMTEEDILLALYLWVGGEKLSFANRELSLLDARDFLGAKKIDFEIIRSEIAAAVKAAFAPFSLIPEGKRKHGVFIFDADFVHTLIARVHKATGYAPDYILWRLSMVSAAYYVIAWLRVDKEVDIPTSQAPSELMSKYSRRVSELFERYKNGCSG